MLQPSFRTLSAEVSRGPAKFGAYRGCRRVRGGAAALPGPGVERRPAGGAAHPGAGGGDDGGDQPSPGPHSGRDSPQFRRGHHREACGQRRDGGMPAGVPARRGGRRRRHHRPRLQPVRRPGHDPSVRPPHNRQRSHSESSGISPLFGRLWPRLAGQRDHRPGRAPGAVQHRGRLPGNRGHVHPRGTLQVWLLRGGERGGEPLGAAPLGTGLPAGPKHGDRPGRRAASQHQRPHRAHRP